MLGTSPNKSTSGVLSSSRCLRHGRLARGQPFVGPLQYRARVFPYVFLRALLCARYGTIGGITAIYCTMKAPFPLATSRIRFQSLLENSPELILYQNAEGIMLDANPAFLTLVQQTRQQVRYWSYYDFLPLQVRTLCWEKLRETLATGHSVRFDLFASQGSSAPRHGDVLKVLLVDHGWVVGVHMLARDRSEKVKSQAALFRQNRDLQQISCIVSHNLRAPLANALGMVNLLRIGKSGSWSFQQAHTHLQASLPQLDQVLHDLNTILASRDQPGRAAPEAVPLADGVRQVVEDLHELVVQAGGTVEVYIPAGLRVPTNPAYLYSIFFHLLSHALKYRADERPRQVLITASRNPAGKTIVVADNGSGFEQERAGTSIFQLDQRFHPHHAGRGVGLYLVNTHVERIGEHMEAYSWVGEGARFLIFLPSGSHANRTH